MISLSDPIILADTGTPAQHIASPAVPRASAPILPDPRMPRPPTDHDALPPEIGFSDDCTHSIRTGREEAERFIDEYMAKVARDGS